MVGVVIGDEEGFAQKILAFAPAEWFVKVGRGIFDKSDEVFLVAVDGSDGLIPGMRGRWFGRLRPVVLRPTHGVVTAGGRRGEVKNVALGDAKVLQELPGRVGEIRWNGAAEVDGKILNGIFEGSMRLAAVEQIDQLFP
jgi:hypothetical protein